MASCARTSTPTIMLLVLVLGLHIGGVWAHSNIGYPAAYSKQSCKADTSCKTPCPPVRGNKKPVATWKRGQKVQIIWHKNNHIGGFYRRSILRIDDMMDHAMHKKTAFDFGCWGQGTFTCGSNEKLCGGDKKQRAYRNTIEIPSIYPDGDYVFAQVWYGGLQWQKKAPKYADYYSCAFVRIAGGAPLTSDPYTAKFQYNPLPKGGFLKGVPLKVCASGSTKPNQCGGDACENGPIMNTVPEEFKNGPTQIVSSKLFGGGGGPSMDPEDVAEAPPDVVAETIQADKQDEKEDEQVAEEQIAMEEEGSAPLKELSAKKGANEGEEEVSYLKEIEVIVGGKKVAAIEDGARRTVAYRGGALKLQVATTTTMESVVISVSGKGSQTQRNKPYTFVWNNPKMNSETTISVTATTKSGKTATMRASVLLSSSSSQATTTTATTKSAPRSSSGCSRDNIPPMPTGSWGPRESRKWKQKRRMYWKRKNFCRRCRNVC